MFKNKIFAGAKAFELIKSKLNVASTSTEMFYGRITIIKHSLMEPNQMVTMDPELVRILKELETNNG